MKRILSLSFLFTVLLLPQATSAVSEECRAGLGGCPNPPNASVCTAPPIIEDVGGCPAGTVWIGDAATGQCKTPSYSPAGACSAGTTSFYCETNTCYTAPKPAPPAVCSTANVHTGSSLPCCLDDQIVVRDSTYPTGWKCEDKSAASNIWSLNGSDAYYNTGNVGIGTDIPEAKLDVEGDIELNNNMLISDYVSSGDIDHFWHDDLLNRWFFNSDTTAKNNHPSSGIAASAFYLRDWDNSILGGNDDRYRVIGRDEAWQFDGGAVAIGVYPDGTWPAGVPEGFLFVDNAVSIGSTFIPNVPLHVQNSTGDVVTTVGTSNYGLQARGNSGGGYFRDNNNSGVLYAGSGDRGLTAFGNIEAGYFYDADSSGLAHVAIGDEGVQGAGNFAGGRFWDRDSSGLAYLGYGDGGIYAQGDSYGAYFVNTALQDGTPGEAYLGYGDIGIRGKGDTGVIGEGDIAGYFYNPTPNDTEVYLSSFGYSVSGEGPININESGEPAFYVSGDEAIWYDGIQFSWGFGGTENYFADEVAIGEAPSASSAMFHVNGGANIAVKGESNYSGGYFRDADSSVYIYSGYGNYGAYTNGQIRTTYTGDAAQSSTSSGALVIGNTGGTHMQIDSNEIMVSNGIADSILYLQSDGGDVYFNGAVAHTSDRRLKENIESLEYGLDEVLALRPVSFDWIDRENAQKSLGLIAQDVQPLIGEVVFDEAIENTDILGVNYVGLIPVLINAIQEQNQQIEELQSALCELDSEISVCQ